MGQSEYVSWEIESTLLFLFLFLFIFLTNTLVEHLRCVFLSCVLCVCLFGWSISWNMTCFWAKWSSFLDGIEEGNGEEKEWKDGLERVFACVSFEFMNFPLCHRTDVSTDVENWKWRCLSCSENAYLLSIEVLLCEGKSWRVECRVECGNLRVWVCCCEGVCRERMNVLWGYITTNATSIIRITVIMNTIKREIVENMQEELLQRSSERDSVLWILCCLKRNDGYYYSN